MLERGDVTMTWFRRSDPETPPAAPPLISDHAKDLLAKSQETRQALERFLNGNHFTQSMKQGLGKKKKRKR